jgi:hypothetical protein
MSEIIESLKNGKVEITFKSLKSGRQIKEICSLHSSEIPNDFSFKQSSDSESILCYLVEKKRWEDINKKTIVSYKEIDT